MGLTIGLLEKSFPRSFLALKRFHERIGAIEEIPTEIRASLKQESFAVALTLADEMYSLKAKAEAISPLAIGIFDALRKGKKR